jgi:hypothetical protein
VENENWRRNEQLAPVDLGCKDCDTQKIPVATLRSAGFTGRKLNIMIFIALVIAELTI